MALNTPATPNGGMELEGTIPPMVTPAEGREGGVDVDALREYTDFLLDGGVHGLFPCGSIGEFPALTREERRRTIEVVADRADGPVLAGCGGTGVAEVRGYVADAADAGADAAVVVTPYYLGSSQASLREFYRAIAEDSPLPILLYNIPGRTDVELAPGTVGGLADHDAIVGIKDSSGSVNYHVRLLEEVPESFAVFQGISGLALPSLDAGADGQVSGAADVFPGPVANLYDAHAAGDRAGAVGIANTVVNPLVSTYADYPTAAALKHLLAEAGIDVGPPRLPLPTLSDAARERLTAAYERAEAAAES